MLDFDTMMAFNRPFLALFFTSVAVFYFTLVQLRKSHQSDKLIHPGRRFTRHWWNHLVFGVFRVLIWFACLARLGFADPVEAFLGTFPLPGALLLLGDCLLLLGFGLAAIASLSMNGQWRSGIDERSQLGLVTNGPYRFSRNPAYIGVQMGQLGFFLAWPSAFSALCLILGVVSVQAQVKLEEEFLGRTYGQAYTRYCNTVRRWI